MAGDMTVGHTADHKSVSVTPLLRRIIAVNAAVYAVGTFVLAVSPATVSSPAALTESLVLAGGLLVMLGANAALLRVALSPLQRLAGLMEQVDLLQPGQRLAKPPSGDFAGLIEAFNAMLARLETERSASSAQALAAQEAERTRVAQELHDEVGQSLTVVLLGLKRTAARAPDGLREELLATQEQVRTTLEEVRTVAGRLRPGVLEDLGLGRALSALVTDFSRHSSAPVQNRVDPNLPAMPDQVELVLYRVAQEALTNVARHAAATNVRLHLGRHPAGVVLRVDDDGRGVEGLTPGAGVTGMRERALLIGAELTVGARPDGGTQVRLVVPLPATLNTATTGVGP